MLYMGWLGEVGWVDVKKGFICPRFMFVPVVIKRKYTYLNRNTIDRIFLSEFKAHTLRVSLSALLAFQIEARLLFKTNLSGTFFFFSSFLRLLILITVFILLATKILHFCFFPFICIISFCSVSWKWERKKLCIAGINFLFTETENR